MQYLKIGIIGGGVVGRATARVWMEHVADVRVYDIDPKRRTCSRISEALECDLVFVCLPTPRSEGSYKADTRLIDELLAEFPNAPYVLRSTVPVGYTSLTTRKYKVGRILHNPEFLTARCSIADAHTPSRNILGYAFDCATSFDRYVLSLYQQRFPGVPTLLMSSRASELTKLALNSFFGVKVTFFNELHALCRKAYISWDSVLEGMLSDGRIAHAHTKVPGPDGRFGFGGTCLPKDMASLIYTLNCHEMVNSLTEAALKINKNYRGQECAITGGESLITHEQGWSGHDGL